MPPVTKVAAVQMDPGLMKTQENLEKILAKTREAALAGANLIVFPECALTGYMFMNREEALPYAQSVPGPATRAVADTCRELGVYVIFGLLENDGTKFYNTAALVGPEGFIGKYRKTHPPFFALDRFVDKGDIPFTVHKTPIGNIGMLICHDLTFPEPSRVLMLKGADIIALPTNWPKQIDVAPRYTVHARALENHLHLIAADRVGVERKAEFLGLSKIVNAAGAAKAEASADKEEIIYAELDLSYPRQKHMVLKPGVWEIDWLKERRPELYGEITELQG